MGRHILTTLRRIVSPRLKVSVIGLNLVCRIRLRRSKFYLVGVALAAVNYPLTSIVASRVRHTLGSIPRMARARIGLI